MLYHALTIAAKDLRIELRAREIVPTMSLFAVLITVLSSMALFEDVNTAKEAAPGVLWITIAFSGTLGLARSWDREREHGAIRALLLSPIPPASIFFGKVMGSLVFVLFTEMLVAPLVALLLNAPVFSHLIPLFVLILLGTIGFVAMGSIFGAMTVRTRARDLTLAVVLYPLVSPALLCGVVATRSLFAGASLSMLRDWIFLLLAFDIIAVVGGAWLLGPLLTD